MTKNRSGKGSVKREARSRNARRLDEALAQVGRGTHVGPVSIDCPHKGCEAGVGTECSVRGGAHRERTAAAAAETAKNEGDHKAGVTQEQLDHAVEVLRRKARDVFFPEDMQQNNALREKQEAARQLLARVGATIGEQVCQHARVRFGCDECAVGYVLQEGKLHSTDGVRGEPRRGNVSVEGALELVVNNVVGEAAAHTAEAVRQVLGALSRVNTSGGVSGLPHVWPDSVVWAVVCKLAEEG